MTRAPSETPARAKALPTRIDPMLAVAGDMPADPENWGFEFKWDGVRCMSFWDGRRLRLLSRNQIVITQRYPELANLGKALGKRAAILDGEIIALDSRGRPSFSRLQNRMHVDHPAPSVVRETPAWYVIFDVLHVAERSTLELPYVDRRELLAGLIASSDHWQVPSYHAGRGAAMLEAARKKAMEGVVAKQLTSAYLPGWRSPQWRKIKIILGQEFVIGGWIPEAGERLDRVGALLLGYYEIGSNGKRALRYAGRVGTGFSDATHSMLVKSLSRVQGSENPFADPFPRGGVIFVQPKRVAEVEYRRWPDGGLVQQAAFKGLRNDKSALKVVKEPQTTGVQ